jgi:molybdopterin-guanine dinucleotide biosynthesis protein A
MDDGTSGRKDVGRVEGDVPEAIGVVLAGGRSRRFGRDKAQVLVDGEPLVERVRGVLRRVLAEVVVVGGAHQDIADEEVDGGPLSAVVSAWRWAGRERPLVVVACDLPNLDEATVRRLAAPLQGCEARVPLVDDERQWLAAHYSKAALSRLEEAMERGERSMWRAAAGITLHNGHDGDIGDDGDDGEGFSELALADADTPTELAEALAKRRALRRQASEPE